MGVLIAKSMRHSSLAFCWAHPTAVSAVEWATRLPISMIAPTSMQSPYGKFAIWGSASKLPANRLAHACNRQHAAEKFR